MATARERDETIIVLARAAPFRLGDVTVSPATREVTRNGESEIVEPRLMQVLVALAEAEGAVVSRDELTARCWEGRIVGDSAINRVISQLRRLASEFGQGSFTLETITKVGYRLIVPDGGLDEIDGPIAKPARQEEESERERPSRRLVVGGALAAAAGVAVIGWQGWQRFGGHNPPPEARDLFRRGEFSQRQGDPDQSRQAVTYLERAVAIDPLYAEAWGALAIAYRHLLEGFGEAEQASLAGRIQSAARRALALDPDNGDARVALVLVEPYYRNWRRAETALRALEREYPRQWMINGQIGQLLGEVGRVEDAIPFLQRQVGLDPNLPVGHMFLARGLSIAGRLQEAEAVHEAAQARWPAHPFLWGTKYAFLLFNGRPGAAAAFVMDPDKRPSGMPPEAADEMIRVARALETQAPAEVDWAVASSLADAEANPLQPHFPIAVLAMFGRTDHVFRIWDRYYLGLPRARWERRYTYGLFAPAHREVRGDPRFRALLDRIGLIAYWRETGTRPDFMKG